VLSGTRIFYAVELSSWISQPFLLPMSFLSEYDSIQGDASHSAPGGFNKVLAFDSGGWRAVRPSERVMIT